MHKHKNTHKSQTETQSHPLIISSLSDLTIPCFDLTRTEQWTWPTRKPDQPNSNRQVLGGFENIQVGFWVLFLGYFRVWVGIGSYKYSSLNSIFFFFFVKKTLIFSPPSALSLFLKPHPYKPSPFTQFKALPLCKS